MKSNIEKLSSIAPYILFPGYMILKKRKALLCVSIFMLIISISGCFWNYYRTNTKSSIDASTTSDLIQQKKYFIIHFKDSIVGLENATIRNDSLFGNIISIPTEHSHYLFPKSTTKTNRVKAKYKGPTLTEVHLFTNETFKSPYQVAAFGLSSFNRADIYKLDKRATTVNHVVSVIGVVAVVAVVATSIAYLIACNCPQLYVENNGGNYNFTSGLYSGAVYAPLERTDYFPLNAIPSATKDISFKIANAKNEEQFINHVNLIQVNHPGDVHVLADRHGHIFSYKLPQPIQSAKAENISDLNETLQTTDGRYYSFDSRSDRNGFSDVILTFEKPVNAENARLIIHAQNTNWGGLLYKEFRSLFGSGFQKWSERQEKVEPEVLEKWQKDQALPLMVYLKTEKGWKFIDYFPLVGNTADRDLIMQLNLNGLTENVIELKLESTYRFWNLDYAGIDFSNRSNYTVNYLEPDQAYNSDGTDERELLKENDKKYVHLQNDEYITFKYRVPQASENTVFSYLLASGGYYHSLEHFDGKPQYSKLTGFKKKGAFDRFSREKYNEVQNLIAWVKE